MIILDARERGLFTRGPAWTRKGRIVSVYKRAVNIRRPDGLLVSLVKDRTQMSALSVHVPELFSPRAPGQAPAAETQPGDRAGFDGRRLTVGGVGIILEGAPWYDSALHLTPRTGFSAAKREALRRALLTRGRGGGLLGLIGPPGPDNALTRLAKKILANASDSGPRLGGLQGLVGLGVGFTPSGDDFLAGVLLGEALAGGESRLRLDRGEIRSVLAKTSDGGRSLLYQALQDHFPHYLIETAAALTTARDESAVDEAVSRAVRYGETSGTDTLTGLLWYLNLVAGIAADMA